MIGASIRNIRRKLRLADPDGSTPADIEMARIAQNWREWSPQGWKPIGEPQKHSALLVDEVLERAYRYAIIERPIPLWKKIIRWLRRQTG